jgi:16S rRNA (guanine527-N7)-methyltransferase
VAAPLSQAEIARELAALEIQLPPAALAQLSRYLELLLHWNRRINLTGLREPREIVRRLFGESLAISRVVHLRGWLVDVGSGAGFPGLALKLVTADLRVTLIEARQKKCAFLKEVIRQCGFTGVEVVAARFEDWVARPVAKADIITTRAVTVGPELLRQIRGLLASGGQAVFLTSAEIATAIQSEHHGPMWSSFDLAATSPGSTLLVMSQ